jgi:hypothetical protein
MFATDGLVMRIFPRHFLHQRRSQFLPDMRLHFVSCAFWNWVSGRVLSPSSSAFPQRRFTSLNAASDLNSAALIVERLSRKRWDLV